MEERRHDPRIDVEVEIEIHYRTLQEFVTAYTRNISGGGVFIRTPKPHELNQKVRLRFTLPGVDHRFDIPGMVVWVNSSSQSAFPAGMGVKFMDPTPADAELIEKFVKKIKGDAPGSEKNKEAGEDKGKTKKN
jgi:type IV pilus assembly protein PilZ